MDDDERQTDANGEGTPTYGGDIVGPGTGGSPTAAGTGDPVEPAEALSEPGVARMLDDLRADERVLDDDIDDAAEQAGTGTDR